jgi:phosphoribosyl-AMP cyclohydrolase
MSDIVESLKYNSDGLIPVVVQDVKNGEVLMLAYMNAEAIRRTLQTGRATYWSRSRQSFWIKGETSGHIQVVKKMSIDCDLDTILIQVEQTGAACHENYRSCFFRDFSADELVLNAEKLP